MQGGTNGVGAYATNTYIAENKVTQNAAISGGFGDVTERGDNTKSVLVDNTISSPSGTCMTIQPQNLQSVEHVINSLVEGNTFVAPLTPFSIAAQHVYVRNNVFVGPDTAVTVLGDSQMPLNWTDKVFLFNNTHYLSNGTGGGDTYFLRHLTSSGTVTVANNILWTSHASTTSSIINADRSGTETNLETQPPLRPQRRSRGELERRDGRPQHGRSAVRLERSRLPPPVEQPGAQRGVVGGGLQRRLGRHAPAGRRLGHRRLRVQAVGASKTTTSRAA